MRCRTGRSARVSTLVAGQLHARTSAGISDDRVARLSVSVRWADDPDRRCRGGQHVAGLVTQFPGQERGGSAAMDHAARAGDPAGSGRARSDLLGQVVPVLAGVVEVDDLGGGRCW